MDAYAVLLDLDGTLLDSTPAYFEITRRACAALGWPAPPASLMRDVMVLRRHPVEILFGECGPGDPRRQALTDAALLLWEGVVEERVRPFADTLATLSRLHGRGLRLGVVTDSNDFVVRQLTALAGCPPLDVVVTRDRSGARKPSPAGIRLALAELGIAPQAAVYIGDNPADIEAGQHAGVRALGITTGSATREDLEACAPLGVLDSLTELADLVQPAPPWVTGQLVTGLGKARGFLELPWVREQLASALGGMYFPGTLNLRLTGAAGQLRLRHREDPALKYTDLRPPPGVCQARCHAVTVHFGAHPPTAGVALWPDVEGYAPEQLELVSAAPLRPAWNLADGDTVTVQYHLR